MNAFFRLPAAQRRDPEVEAWFAHGDPLRALVQPWFAQLRGFGPDICELIHDGHPTACVGDTAFAYVAAFTKHASIGFFFGAFLHDPAGLLEGTGRYMRHVKLRYGHMPEEAALGDLLVAACHDIRRRLDEARR